MMKLQTLLQTSRYLLLMLVLTQKIGNQITISSNSSVRVSIPTPCLAWLIPKTLRKLN